MIQAAAARPSSASVLTLAPTLPLLGTPYTAIVGAGCFPAAGVCISAGSIVLDDLVSSEFDAAGQAIVTTASYSGALTTLGGALLGPLTLAGTVEQFVVGRTIANQVGTWTTTLVALSLAGPALGHTLTVGLDPTHESLGETSLVPLGAGQLFLADSFFDIFVRIGLDSDPPLSATRGPLRFETVPEPSAALILGLGVAGFLAYRRTIAR
jgi:hypothetical protein